MPRSKPVSDQSLGQFFRHRLGNEVVENLIEPLLSGIYAGDIDQMSLMSTFPQMYQIEQKHRSISLGMRTLAPKEEKAEPKKGMFQTVKTGLESIVKSLEAKMHEGTIIKGTRIEKVAKQGDGYTITLSNGKEIEADAIVVATSHKVLPSMFAQYKQFRFFRNIPSTSVANVALAFKSLQSSAILMVQDLSYHEIAITPLQHVRGRIKMAAYNARRKNTPSLLRRACW